MDTRAYRVRKAQETLHIIGQGFYTVRAFKDALNPYFPSFEYLK